MTALDKQKISKLLQHLGGVSNIIHAGNCMTRLRISLKDDNLANLTAIKAINGVLGVVEAQDQLQIILGPGKASKAADLMNQILNEGKTEESDNVVTIAKQHKQQLKAKQTNPIQQFLTKFATIFTPLIPGFIGAALLLGIATLLQQIFITDNDTSHTMLSELINFMKVFSKGLFSFLSILIGYNASKAFGGNGVNGAIIASLFILGYNPDAQTGIYSGMSTFFGLGIDPRGNIIGVLIAAIVGAKVEQFIQKLVPDNLNMVLTSTLTLLVMGVFTFLIIMPIGVILFNQISWLFSHLNSNPFGCALLAGLFLITVMLGIHQGFIPVYFALMETQGFNALFPVLCMGGAGQIGASLALYAKAGKNSILRNQIRGAIIPAFLGVAEPLIYGVTLPRLKPFITSCIGGASGGFAIGLIAYLGLPMGLNSVFGPAGLLATPLMTSNSGVFPAIAVYIFGTLTAYTIGFIATYFFGSKDVDLS